MTFTHPGGSFFRPLRKAAWPMLALAATLAALALAACAGVRSDECRGLSAREKQDAVRVAACQGEMEAEYRLGLRYEKGDGKTAPDLERARFWYALAARPRENKTLVYAPAPGKGRGTLLSVPRPETPGHAGAQYRLGLLYAQGRGVERDEAAAREWFGKAAAQGYVQARIMLMVLDDLDKVMRAQAKAVQAKSSPPHKPSEPAQADKPKPTSEPDAVAADVPKEDCEPLSRDILNDSFHPWTQRELGKGLKCPVWWRVFNQHFSPQSKKPAPETPGNGKTLVPDRDYVRWGRDVTIWLVSKNPEDREILEEAIAQLPDLPIRISISDKRGDFRIVAFGPDSQIADKRYCILIEGCEHSFINVVFSEGKLDETGKRVWSHEGLRFFKIKNFHHLFGKWLAADNKTGINYQQENWVLFTPIARALPANVTGYIARSPDGAIDRAECLYQQESDAGDNRLRKRAIRECLLRGLGVVSGSQCATGLSPVMAMHKLNRKQRWAATPAFLNKARENNDYSDCDMALVKKLYELPAGQSSGGIR
jgi:hypothetical protein